MPTKQPPAGPDQINRDGLDSRIRDQVIGTLGKPVDLVLVQVRQLWENHYRVNVLVGANAVTFKIVNSYFVEGDSDGNIIESTPKMVKQY
jgi:hypothetical protein